MKYIRENFLEEMKYKKENHKMKTKLSIKTKPITIKTKITE